MLACLIGKRFWVTRSQLNGAVDFGNELRAKFRAVVDRIGAPRRRTQPVRRAERRPSASSLQAGINRGLDVFPRDDVVRIGFMLYKPAIKFCLLSIC